jgi:hypothetical protein
MGSTCLQTNEVGKVGTNCCWCEQTSHPLDGINQPNISSIRRKQPTEVSFHLYDGSNNLHQPTDGLMNRTQPMFQISDCLRTIDYKIKDFNFSDNVSLELVYYVRWVLW